MVTKLTLLTQLLLNIISFTEKRIFFKIKILLCSLVSLIVCWSLILKVRSSNPAGTIKQFYGLDNSTLIN